MSSPKASRHLTLYRDYVGKTFDRLELLRLIAARFQVKRGLYPGSYVHITPSLLIPSMTYVDTDKRTRDFFVDASVLSFVHRQREYEEPAEVRYHFADYRTALDESNASFDLLISQWAGFVSQSCKRYLKKGGILVANNSHGDASMASLDDDYALVGVVSKSNRLVEDNLGDFFVPKKLGPNTREHVARVGRGIAYTKSAPYYLFRRR